MNSTSLNLLSEDAVIGFALTEAFEWAKHEGDKNAGIDALRPFKAAYAMLLTDLGMNETALKYINYVLQSTFSTKVDADSTKEVPPLALSLSTASGDQSFFLSWLRRLHARLESLLKKQQIDFCSSHLNAAVRSDSLPERVGSFGDLTYQAETDSDPMKKPFFSVSEDLPNNNSSNVQSLDSNVGFSSRLEPSVPLFTPLKQPEQIQTTVQTPSPSTSDNGINKHHVSTSKPPAAPSTASAGHAASTEKPPMAPMSAPANLEQPRKEAPSSSVKRRGLFDFGIKDRMTKWLNPDATKADIGEPMQAYYDDKRKVWVFPGEDPDETVKPIGPPPTTSTSVPTLAAALPPPTSNDPLAAMMAPPSRSAISKSKMGAEPYHLATPGKVPMAYTPVPSFAVFQPST